MTYAPIQGTCLVCHQDSANTSFKAGAASRDAEIESLRQQLANRELEVQHVLGKVVLVEQQLAEAQADRDAIKKEWEKAYEIGMLAKQQLAAVIAACKLKDEALDYVDSENASEEVIRRCSAALSIQSDDSALKDEWRFK